MPPIPQTPIKLAVLDDYHSIAPHHFSSLGSTFSTTHIPDTLPPFNHPSTTETQKQELIDRLKPYTIISTMRERTPFPSNLLSQLPSLKLLLTTGERNRGIDIPFAKSRGIVVTGTNPEGKELFKEKGKWGEKREIKGRRRRIGMTTEHTIALILGITRNIAWNDKVLKEEKESWQTRFATGLERKVFGVLGLGKLGVKAAKIMWEVFGMEVLAWSESLTQEIADAKAKECGLEVEDEQGEKTFKVALDKAELFEKADVLSIHYVLSSRSRGMVGPTELAKMKPTAYLINTSRGPIVDETALLEILKEERIRGAALDVFELEPLPEDSEWRSTEWGRKGRSLLLLSPHMGYVEEEVMNRCYEAQVENVGRWWRGEGLGMILEG